MVKLSRNTLILSSTSFLVDISSEMIFPLLPFFLINILFAPDYAIGLMEGISGLVISLLAFFSGVYTDRLGRKKTTILSGYSISTLFKGFLIVATSWQQIFVLRILERLGKGMRETPRDALIALSEPPKNLGRAFGFRKLFDNIGAILGPLIASVIVLLYFNNSHSAESYRFLFTIGLFPAILSVILLLFLQDHATRQKQPIASLRELFQSRKLRNLLVVSAVFSLGQFTTFFFLLRANQYMELYLVPLAYLAFNIFYALFSLPVGYFTDRFGAKNALTVGFLCFLVVLLGFGLFPSLQTIFLMFLLLGIFMAVVETVPQVFIVRTVQKDQYASAIGTYKGVVGLLALPANIFAGLLWSVNLFTIPGTFVFSIVTTILALFLLIVLIE